jgi:hypothetical protein
MSLVEKNALDEAAFQLSEATAADYFALLKPRVMSLVVFTACVGLVAAPVATNPFIAIIAVLAIAVGAGVGRPQHVVRRRYRCGHGAHRQAADTWAAYARKKPSSGRSCRRYR